MSASPSLNVTPTFGGVAAVVLVGAIAALGVTLYAKRKAIGEGAEKLADAVNPTSANNVAYRAVTKLTEAVTGDDRPFGVQLWEWLHPAQVEAERRALGPTLERPGYIVRLPVRDVTVESVVTPYWLQYNENGAQIPSPFMVGA